MTDPIALQAALLDLERKAGGAERTTLREARQTIATFYLLALQVQAEVREALDGKPA